MAKVIRLKKNHHHEEDPPFMSTCSLRTLLFGHLSTWNHVPNVSLAVQMPGVTRLKLFASHSNGWHHPFNFFLAVWMAGITHSKFFIYHSNRWYHPFKITPVSYERLGSSIQISLCPLNGWHMFEIFAVPFKSLQHLFDILMWPFIWYLKLFWMAGTSVSNPFFSRSSGVGFVCLTDIRE